MIFLYTAVSRSDLPVLEHFGHRHFGHGRFGQDISATDISATDISANGHFGHGHFGHGKNTILFADGIQLFTTLKDLYVRSLQVNTIENIRKRIYILFST